MGKKKKNSSSLIMCVAVALVAVIAIFGVGVYGLFSTRNNGDGSDTVKDNSVFIDTDDNSSAQSGNQSSNASSEQAVSNVTSSNTSSSSSISSTTSSGTSSDYGDAGSKDFPENDGDKVCYLTFDDGPSTKVTTRILDTLKEYDVKATFFVAGTGNMSLLTRMKDEGHAIGLHTDTHDYAKVYASSSAYFKDLNAVSDKVYEATGIRSKIIRFPGGSNNTVSKKYCKGIMTQLAYEVQQQGYQYFDWNVDSLDANASYMQNGKTPKKTIVDNILHSAKNKDKICVLMHDIAAKTTTADALPEIIEGLKAQGFRFEALTTGSPVFHFKVAN